jgi:hypothetical protein
MHTNVVVGEAGTYDEVDCDVMRVKLPPAATTPAVETRQCRNAGCQGSILQNTFSAENF